MDGFIVIDKPLGKTSHDVVSAVRRILGTKKVGHTGTLDPFATGVLPIAVGEATKAIQFLDESVKEYRAVMRLGAATDTQDCTGKTIAEFDCSGITADAVKKALARFTGVINQIPPMFSAIKKDGKPLYVLARRGVEIEREPRKIEIFTLELEGFASPDATFTVACSPGTYVRTLANDIGIALKNGAHLVSLQRTRSGLFSLDSAISLERLSELHETGCSNDFLVSPLDALHNLPEVAVGQDDTARIRNGVTPHCHVAIVSAVRGYGTSHRLMLSGQGRLLAVAEANVDDTDNTLKNLRLLRVFN